MGKQDEMKTFFIRRDTQCGVCGEELWKGSMITLDREKGALCMSCAGMDHLWFLPSGDAALTRRAKKHSGMYAVVLQWARARKRYERQGILVEKEALEQAEKECLADQDQRERRKEREALKRKELDKQFIEQFAAKIRGQYPGIPSGREKTIAEHACRKYSGRVGRSQAAKEFSEDAIRLAVIAHIRHTETNYDELLMRGYDPFDARMLVRDQVDSKLEEWEGED
ncbi:MAG: DUF2293 domain-containing protein [Bacteroidales bacterium]|nr:DUF2293 domain-containing protein [Bacteroidales bacterium]